MKYFGEVYWSEETKNNTGIPRPYYNIPKSLQTKQNLEDPTKTIFYLHKKVPIPWQSIAVFKNGGLLHLNHKNEKEAIAKELCPFCGIKIEDSEICIRWITNDTIPSHKGPRVFSDVMPFHLECMKQGRIFCPYMREKRKKDFEIGKFEDLIKNARDEIKKYPPAE